jgi:hypothetical protein
MTTYLDYLKNKLVDPRIRIIACIQRRKKVYLPGKNTYPFYDDGVAIGSISKPIGIGSYNTHMVE